MIKGKGFRGALRYNLEKVEKGAAEILSHSFAEATEKMIMKEIQMVRVLRPNLQKYFYHTSINFPPHEKLTGQQMNVIATDYLTAAGFTQHQFIVFQHFDAHHPHLHILANRIGLDGKVLNDSNDFARTEKILRELETKYKLTQVISSKQATKRATTKNEIEMRRRTRQESHKVRLQLIVKEVLSSKPTLTCTEFVRALQSRDVGVRFNIASTGYVSGISYAFKGFVTTGSKLGNDFKWTTLKTRIDFHQHRDRAIIVAANTGMKISPAVENRNSDSTRQRPVESCSPLKWITEAILKDAASDTPSEQLLQNSSMRKRRRKRRRRT